MSSSDWKAHILEAAAATNVLSRSQIDSIEPLLNASDIEAACQLVWQHISHTLLTPDMELKVHQALLAAVYSPWPRQVRGPYPIWWPTHDREASHNVTRFLTTFKGDAEFESSRGAGGPGGDWQLLHALSIRDPERVLSALIRGELNIPFHVPPTRVIEFAPNPDACVWLPGAAMNIAWCALHSPRAGPRGDEGAAVAWAEEGRPEEVHTLSRKKLRALALHVAVCLKQMGLKPGDAVAVVLPLTVTSIAIYLGIVLSGCIMVSIADSFAAHEVEARLRISGAQLVVTQDVIMRGGKPLHLLNRVVSHDKSPRAIVLPGTLDQARLLDTFWPTAGQPAAISTTTPFPQLRSGDLTWEGFLGLASTADAHAAACLPASARPSPLHVASPNQATNILFSSGTTGEPKAIIWDHVSPLRCGVDGWAHQAILPGERVCWPTSLGWMMGPWLIYAAMLNGACVTLYNGAPLGRDFGFFVKAADVHVLGLVPSIVKVWRHTNCMKGIDWPSLKTIASTGEASSPDDYHWLYAAMRYKVPVIEYCGGTELSGSYITGSTLLPASPSTFTTPSISTQVVLLVPPTSATRLGLDVVICDSGPVGLSPHAPVAPPVTGEVAVVAPVLGGAQRLLNKDHYQVYYDGMPTYPLTNRPLRRHGDELCRLPGGYYTALGRVDDTMNLGGIKVSSVELERAVMDGVSTVSEVAAVGVPTPGGGPEQLVLFVVLRAGQMAKNTELLAACNAAIRSQLNPLFKVERVSVMTALPRNASNKLMRRTLRDELMAAAVVQTPRSKL